MTESAMAGRRVVIVGSAPGVHVPPARPDDLVVGANGGARHAARQGRRVDILSTTSHLFRPDGATRSEQYTRRQLVGMRFAATWVDERNGRFYPAGTGIFPGRIRRVSRRCRSWIVSRASGRDLWVSTGVFAACLAIVSGATEIVLVGISLAPGHAGLVADTDSRHHVTEDASCLRAISSSVDLEPRLRRAIAA